MQLNKLSRGQQLRVRAYAHGIRIKEWADEAGYTRQYMTSVLVGREVSPVAFERIEAALERLLELRQEAQAA